MTWSAETGDKAQSDNEAQQDNEAQLHGAARYSDDDMYLDDESSLHKAARGPLDKHSEEYEDRPTTESDEDLEYAQKHGISNLLQVRASLSIM